MKKSAPIFLVGFMGAGKTTVGRALAERLNYDFVDLDEMVERLAGKPIQRIFSESGEAEFRRLETSAIQSCGDYKKSVVALGGGAYVSQTNRDILRAIGKTIWLDCPIEICLARIRYDESRPLLACDTEMKALLERRLPAYALADFMVETDSRSPEEIALQIIELLSEQGPAS